MTIHQRQAPRRRAASWTAALAAVAVLAAVVALAAGGIAAQELRFFRIGTGTTGGTYFPIGGMIATAISGPPGGPSCAIGGSCGVPGLIAVAQASSGSVENIVGIHSGTIESGLSQADIAFWGYTGTGLFHEDGAMPELRAIARLYSELVHIVVPADSDIHTIADLAGRRVSLGEEGSGTLIDMRILLAAHGLGEADLTPLYLRPDRSGDLLIKGELDAFAIIGGAPLPAVADLARRLPIRLLPIEDAVSADLLVDYPFFVPAAFEAGAYEGVEAVPTIAVGAIWVTTTTVDEETVHGITRALWHATTLALLKGGHPRGAEIVLDKALQGLGIPLHPGAERFYAEQGLELPAQAAEDGHPPPG